MKLSSVYAHSPVLLQNIAVSIYGLKLVGREYGKILFALTFQFLNFLDNR
jgi:hypothetical protein